MSKEIVEAIEKDNLVLFVGAGMSLSLNYPDWNSLITQILEKLDEEYQDTTPVNFKYFLKQGKNIDVFKALDDLEKNNLKSDVKTHLHNIISSNSIDDQKLDKHKKLWKISNKIITTNYDQALEKVKPDSVVVYDSENKFQQYKSISGIPFLFKI